MITVGDIYGYLCELYPLDTACDFDNPGMLIGDASSPVSKALVCLDCDRITANEAINGHYELIITHHPVIWEGLKSITADRFIYSLIKNGISVISMHTNLDVGEGGVNDCLCKAIGLDNIDFFTASDGFSLRQGTLDSLTADELALRLKDALKGSVRYVGGSSPINRVLVCSGSGGNYLYEAAACGFDALVTADIKHNLLIDAINCNISLFDAGHYETERIVCAPLSGILSDKFSDVQFTVFDHKKIKSV